MHIFLMICGLFLSATNLFASAGEPKITAFSVTPSTLFTGEDRTVFASVSFAEHTDAQIDLVQYETEGKVVKYRWALNDAGKQGDRIAGDGIHSCYFQLKKRRPEIIHLALQHKRTPLRAAPTTIQIIARPTFTQVLRDLWNKFIAQL